MCSPLVILAAAAGCASEDDAARRASSTKEKSSSITGAENGTGGASPTLAGSVAAQGSLVDQTPTKGPIILEPAPGPRRRRLHRDRAHAPGERLPRDLRDRQGLHQRGHGTGGTAPHFAFGGTIALGKKWVVGTPAWTKAAANTAAPVNEYADEYGSYGSYGDDDDDYGYGGGGGGICADDSYDSYGEYGSYDTGGYGSSYGDDAAAANNIAVALSCGVSPIATPTGKKPAMSRTRSAATPKLARPPIAISTNDSLNKFPTSQPRLAPSEARVAISPARAAPRASSRFAMFTQTIRSTSAVTTSNSVSGLAACPAMTLALSARRERNCRARSGRTCPPASRRVQCGASTSLRTPA